MKKSFLLGGLVLTAGLLFLGVNQASGILLFSSEVFEMDTEPTYVSGQFGKAFKVGQNDVPNYTFKDYEGLNPNQGTIEVWVKPDDWQNAPNGYWEILSVVNTDGQDVMEFRRGKDNNYDVMQFIAYKPNGGFQAWRNTIEDNFTWVDGTWYHLAVSWSQTQSPIVHVNGVEYELVPAYSETTWDIRDFDGGKVYLGQRGNESVRKNNYFNHAGRATFDEVRVSNKIRSHSEIVASYNNGNGTLLTMDDDTLWLAHFDSNLYLNVNSMVTAEKWLMREVRKCDTMAFDTTHPNDGDQDFKIGDYRNYTCGNRYQEQCINDGTADSYYS